MIIILAVAHGRDHKLQQTSTTTQSLGRNWKTHIRQTDNQEPRIDKGARSAYSLRRRLRRATRRDWSPELYTVHARLDGILAPLNYVWMTARA